MRGKRLLTLIGSICLVLILAALPFTAACAPEEVTPTPPEEKPTPPPTPPKPEVIEWRIQTMWAPGTFDQERFAESPLGFCKLVEKASGGRLIIKPFTSGAIVPVPEHLEAVGIGVIEGSVTSPAYWAGKIPVAGFAACLPYSLEGLSDVDTYLWELGIIDIVREAYREFNVYPVSICNNTDSPLMSKKPIYTVDDFKGLKVRVIGMQADTLTRLGASVTYLPSPEIYMGLERGVIEACNFGGVKSESDLGLHEVTEYILLPPVSESISSEIMINLDAWEALSDEMKAIVETSAYTYHSKYSRQLWLHNQLKLNELVAEGKMEVITMPPEEVAKLRAVAYEVIKEYSTRDDYCARAFKILDDYLRLRGYIE